jgi:hypothetical protein
LEACAGRVTGAGGLLGAAAPESLAAHLHPAQRTSDGGVVPALAGRFPAGGRDAGATPGSAPTYTLSVVNLASGAATPLAADAHWHAVAPGGRILFMAGAAQPIPAPFEGGDLFAVAFDGVAPLRVAAGALWCSSNGSPFTGPTPPPPPGPVTISADGSGIAFLAGEALDGAAPPFGPVPAHWSLSTRPPASPVPPRPSRRSAARSSWVLRSPSPAWTSGSRRTRRTSSSRTARWSSRR